MDYKKHYDALIERAKNRILVEGYKEIHHIIPKCVGGSDSRDNLVVLTPEEHYVAHQLLAKLHPTNGALIKAVCMMTVGHWRNNKLYGWVRKKFSVEMSIAQSGVKNSQYETIWVYNEELRKFKKISIDDIIEEGWVKGRVLNWDKYFKNKNKDNIKKIRTKCDKVLYVDKKERIYAIKQAKKQKRILLKEEEQLRNRDYAIRLYNKYVEMGFVSIREFVRQGYYDKSHVSLTILWKKYIPEYNEKLRDNNLTKLKKLDK